MTIRRTTTVAISIFAALSLLASCSKKPSDEEVVAAVTARIKDVNDLRGQCGGAKAKLGKVASITLTERGIYNEKSEFWPVRVTVKGRCSGFGASRSTEPPPDRPQWGAGPTDSSPKDGWNWATYYAQVSPPGGGSAPGGGVDCDCEILKEYLIKKDNFGKYIAWAP